MAGPEGPAELGVLDLAEHLTVGDRRPHRGGEAADGAGLVGEDRLLHLHGLEHEHEVRLDDHSRIDFLTAAGVGIEVKIAGSVEDVLRQLIRYSQHPRVQALVLVTTIAAHRVMPRELGLKPVLVCSLIGQGLQPLSAGSGRAGLLLKEPPKALARHAQGKAAAGLCDRSAPAPVG